MCNWFWAFQKVKGEKEGRGENVDNLCKDFEFIRAFLQVVNSPSLPKGDGKFSRVKTWAKSTRESFELLKQNFKGEDEILLAFLLAYDNAISCIETAIDRIEKGH